MKLKAPSLGSVVHLQSTPIDEGKEGAICLLQNNPNLVAKVFNKGERSSSKLKKLRAMLKSGPPGNGRQVTAWPRDLLVDGRGQVVGYVMPRVEGTSLYVVFRPGLRKKEVPDLNRRHLYRIAAQLAEATAAVHAEGHAVNDFHPKNVIVSPKGPVLVDCDSYEITWRGEVLRCKVGVPAYLPHEYQDKKDFSSFEGGAEVDQFALGVLIFQILMQGVHPYAGTYPDMSGANRLADRIAGREWPFDPDSKAEPPEKAPPLKVLDPELRALFTECFVGGRWRPLRRPIARRWAERLDEVASRLHRCVEGHYFSSFHPKCPWCGKKAIRGQNESSSQNENPSQGNGSGSGNWLDKYKSQNSQSRAPCQQKAPQQKNRRPKPKAPAPPSSSPTVMPPPQLAQAQELAVAGK